MRDLAGPLVINHAMLIIAWETIQFNRGVVALRTAQEFILKHVLTSAPHLWTNVTFALDKYLATFCCDEGVCPNPMDARGIAVQSDDSYLLMCLRRPWRRRNRVPAGGEILPAGVHRSARERSRSRRLSRLLRRPRRRLSQRRHPSRRHRRCPRRRLFRRRSRSRRLDERAVRIPSRAVTGPHSVVS
jgi:hypothetical protein